MTECWLQRLDTSPAGFLQRKFGLQGREPAKAGRPKTAEATSGATP